MDRRWDNLFLFVCIWFQTLDKTIGFFVFKGLNGGTGPEGLSGWPGSLVSLPLASSLAVGFTELLLKNNKYDEFTFVYLIIFVFVTKGLPGLQGEQGDLGEKGEQVN